MASLELKILPLIQVVILALAMLFTTPFLVQSSINQDLLIIIFVLFLLVGVLCIALGAIAFRRAQTTVNPTTPQSSTSLVNNGIYRLTRNPMYLGMALILIGFASLLNSPISLIFVVIFVGYMTRFQIQPEERILKDKFGEEYTTYCNNVRRWI